MITPDKIIKVLLILLLLMLWPLIGGQGGYIRVVSLSEELADIKEQNALTLKKTNAWPLKSAPWCGELMPLKSAPATILIWSDPAKCSFVSKDLKKFSREMLFPPIF